MWGLGVKGLGLTGLGIRGLGLSVGGLSQSLHLGSAKAKPYL